MTEVALAGLSVADPPERWAALGLTVRDGELRAGTVTVTLGIAPPGGGIVGWALAGLERVGDIGGLATRRVDARVGEAPVGDARVGKAPVGDARVGEAPVGKAPVGEAPVGEPPVIDHVVVATPAFDALAAELAERGLPLRRITELRGTRMGFRRLGGPILEVVEAPDAQATRFWGVTFAVAGTPGVAGSLDELCAANPLIGTPRPAVQPGRRIATVAREARLSTRVAFIDPEPV